MNKQISIAATSLTLAIGLACSTASAQDLGSLGSMVPGGMSSGSMGNVAGLLKYCVTNNYLGGDSGAAGIQDQLMGKMGGSSGGDDGDGDGGSSTSDMLGQLTGSSKPTSEAPAGDSDPTSDPAYIAGAKGMLQSGDGKTTNLGALGGGSSSLKSKLTKQACDAALKQGKSFL